MPVLNEYIDNYETQLKICGGGNGFQVSNTDVNLIRAIFCFHLSLKEKNYHK